MLKNVLEDYLTSIKEIQFFVPFKQLLYLKGFYDIHQLHGGYEFGKDFIAKKKENGVEEQFIFQIKVGDINLKKFNSEVKQQLLQCITNDLSHPNFNSTIKKKIVFVTTGIISPPAAIDFQQLNEYVFNHLKSNKIKSWEKDDLISDFLSLGLEQVYTLNNDPEYIGDFFLFYAKLKNNNPVSSFEIEKYTRKWLNLDWNIDENKFFIFLEAYIFVKVLNLNHNYYESILVLFSLIRILIKNSDIQNNIEPLAEYMRFIFTLMCNYIEGKDENKVWLIDECPNIFKIFYYPIGCLKTVEILSFGVLFFDDIRIEKNFLSIIDKEPGCFHPVSDNYAISVLLVCLGLLKLNEKEKLKKYLNNVTVWLCDRYENIGIAGLGSNEQEEIEQLLSEYLSGFNYKNNNSSFLASVLLDISAYINEKTLYENIANDLRSVGVIPEFFHILNDESIVLYNHNSIKRCHDAQFSLSLKKNYSEFIKYERDNNEISIRSEWLIAVILLMRDRYFPTFIFDILK